jgi:hypothetical protein
LPILRASAIGLSPCLGALLLRPATGHAREQQQRKNSE